MPAPMSPETFFEREVLDRNGEKIGRVEDLYVDDSTGKPAFLLVSGGLFGIRKHFVPVASATLEGDDAIRVAVDRDTATSAPSVSADDQLSAAEEKALFDYYGMGDQHPGERVMLVTWEVYVA